MKTTKKNNPLFRIIFFILMILCFVFYTKYKKNHSKNAEKEIHYQGVIQKIRLDKKKIYFVTINDKEFYLNDYPIRGTYSNLKIGDSLVKKKNQSFLKHYKKKQSKYELYKKYSIK
ncbi:hypothetical protein [uncultured Croceitalea sp.]|uniref:hypothetical protein n=1 Tax=uncultured Croceitalea sp. TaxID=1798908 RepID=UPI0033067BCA